MLQPSIAPFVQMPHVTSFTPKIGSKVSMLANVRETLTKRYQLAKAVRIESHRRMNIIERLKVSDLLRLSQNANLYKDVEGLYQAKYHV